jgi:hypothetical protein
MTPIHVNITLEHALLACAVFQGATASVNLFLERLLGWDAELEKMPLLLRQVHRVHAWFISVTVAMFAILTWRFAGDLAAGGNDALRWLAGGIAIFWTLRVALQLGYYSPSHWRGKPGRTVIHFVALAGFAGMAACYWRVATAG